MTRTGRIAFSVVVFVVVLGELLDYLFNHGQPMGSLLILGTTALVVVWYADETRRLSASSMRPELVIYCPYYPPSEDALRVQWGGSPHTRSRAAQRSRVVNRGLHDVGLAAPALADS